MLHENRNYNNLVVEHKINIIGFTMRTLWGDKYKYVPNMQFLSSFTNK